MDKQEWKHVNQVLIQCVEPLEGVGKRMDREEIIEVLKQHRDYLGREWKYTKEAIGQAICELETMRDLENLLIKLSMFEGTVKADFLINWINNRLYKAWQVESDDVKA